MLGALTSQSPGLRRHLYTDEGKLRSFVNVYVNDEDIRYLQKDATPVEGGRHDLDRAEHRRRRDGRDACADRRFRRKRSCATAGT